MPTKPRKLNPLTTGLKVAATGGSLWLGATIWVWAVQRKIRLPDVTDPCPALVLGCHPGPRLRRRVTAALTLYQQSRVDRIIISGCGEAELGVQWARAAGVPSSDLVMETRAVNTRQNIDFARAFLTDNRVWVVSCRWHLPRALKIANNYSLTAYPYPVDEEEARRVSIRRMGREGLSVVHHLL